MVGWVWPLVWANMLIYVWAAYEKAPARHDVRVLWTGRPPIAIPADSANIVVIIRHQTREREEGVVCTPGPKRKKMKMKKANLALYGEYYSPPTWILGISGISKGIRDHR
ncbi:hypothetical protein F5B19DRAFT_152207 [Rostrohypoxylon terebratum]|nr:hypothetical protein F5B19DRAFT_152207 [Rostrohypoxylon terebratum]